ncbi:MAG: STAS domain-containing protein [Actinobacteria bacterium]|nr:STAS domain-containing protein [Actinomycetota bacterium]MCA1721682.1 STAS domain-containing protein [Actinomycetota bacterium]
MSAAGRPTLRVTATAAGPTTVLRLAGDLDLATAGQLRGKLLEVLDTADVRRLVLDLAGLDFMDVTGLNVIVDAHDLLRSDGGALALRSPRPMVLRMLKLLALDEVVGVED